MKIVISVNGKAFEIDETGQVKQKTLLQEQEIISSPELRAFFDKLAKNPFDHVRRNLHRFLERCGLKITKDGNFIGYKAVRSDFYDIYSGTIKYEVGSKVTIPLSECDPNPTVTCSKGLHVGTLDYAMNYGGPDSVILEAEVDPRDVVSVPEEEVDKLRCHSLYVRDVVKTSEDTEDEDVQEEDTIETDPNLKDLPALVRIGKYKYKLEEVTTSKPKGVKLKYVKWPKRVSSELKKIGEKLYAGANIRVVKIGDVYAIYRRMGG